MLNAKLKNHIACTILRERERERETCKYGPCQHSRLLDILPKQIDPCLELFEVPAAIT